MNNSLLAQLAAICGQQHLLSDKRLMNDYSHDWRKRYQADALAVIFPQSTHEIQQIIGLCHSENVAIIPQGGNTSTCGGATPVANYPRQQIILNLKRMNRIISFDKENSSLIVEAGCTLQQIQEFAAAQQMYFPLSLASQGSCQIGGNLATNAGGIQVLKYGMMRDLCLGLEVVLSDQRIINQLHSLRKNNCYLDLKQLFIGSEGSLGIISQASLKLYPQPASLCTLAAGVSHLSSALELLHKLRRQYNNNVSAFEIIKRDSLQLYQQQFPSQPLPVEGEWLLIVELETNADFNQDSFIDLVVSCQIAIDSCLIASNQRERQELWKIREQIPLAEKQHGFAVKHDISLPLSQIEHFLSLNMPKLLAVAAEGYFSIFGHLGDGNLHYNFGINQQTRQETEQLEEVIAPLVYQDVVALGGSIAAEHGIGLSKKKWLKRFSQPNSYQLLCQIKTLLDPANLFNPAKIIDLD